MRKTLYILSFVLLSAGFLACENEPIDEVVTNDYLKGEAIVRFDLNGVTYGARANEVVSNYDNSNGLLSIGIYAKDENNDFNKVTLSIVISSTEKDLYSWDLYSNSAAYSMAGIRYAGIPWDYNTLFSYGTEVDRGSLTITEINEYAGQIEGNFSFILFPLPEEELDLPDDVPYPDPQKIENGYFKYINYKD